MNLQMLNMVFAGMLVLMGIMSLYGSWAMWKVNNKFMSFVYLALAVIVGFATYSIYGGMIAKLFG